MNVAGLFTELNPYHPANNNVICAAVAKPSPGRMFDVYSDQISSPAASGMQAQIMPVIGLAQKFSASGNRVTFNDRKNVLVQLHTFAGPIWLTSLAATSVPYQNGGNGALVVQVLITTGELALFRSTQGTVGSGIFLAIETPYFIAISYNGIPASGSRIIEFYVRNLNTGVVQVSRVTNSVFSVSATAVNCTLGSAAGGTSPFQGYIGWFINSACYLTQAALQNWGNNYENIFLTDESELFEVSASSTTSVVNSCTLQWNDKATVATQRTIQWNVKQTITKSETFQWNIRNVVTKANTFQWNVRNAVVKSVTGQWNVRNLVIKSESFRWNIRNVVTQSETAQWRIKNTVARSIALEWNVLTENVVITDLTITASAPNTIITALAPDVIISVSTNNTIISV